MRIFVSHDDHGSIRMAVIPSEGTEGQLGVDPQPGLHISEIEVPEIDAKKLAATEGNREARARLFDEISKSLQQQRVDVKNKKLVKTG